MAYVNPIAQPFRSEGSKVNTCSFWSKNSPPPEGKNPPILNWTAPLSCAVAAPIPPPAASIAAATFVHMLRRILAPRRRSLARRHGGELQGKRHAETPWQQRF